MQLFNRHSDFIWHSCKADPNEICVFRRDFDLSALPEHAVAYVAAETRYYLWLNGHQVVYEGGLLRESMPGCGWVDVVELSPHLKAGSNLLEIWVYYYGNGGRNNTRLPMAGLLFESSDLGIYSDERFMCRRHPAFYTPGSPKPSYLYGGDNLGYDARYDSIVAPSCDGFMPAKRIDSMAFGDLYVRPIPQTIIRPAQAVDSIRYVAGRYVADLPYAMNAVPVIHVKANGGERIDVRTDRWEVNGGPGDDTNRYHGHRLEFICKHGDNRFESLISLFGEKLIMELPASARLTGVEFRETGFDTRIVGRFSSSNAIMDRLVEKAARTLYVCMRDNFMDCPDRERGQWIGDVSVQVPQAAFLMDARAMLLVRKAICDFINLRKGDALVGNVPGEHSSELPSQSLAALSEWGLVAQYIKYTGDIDVLRLAFGPAIRYLKLWRMGGDGLIIQRSGNWQWYDHLYNCDGIVIENAWYISALRFMRKAADMLSDHTHDEFLDSRMQTLTAAFERAFWKDGYYGSQNGMVDDRANALAVLCGACPVERYAHIRRILLSVFNSSIYMENYVLTALCEMGYIKDAQKRMLARYYNLSSNEDSTLWEDFYLLGTRNHAWSGAPATIAFRYFMGIDIDAAAGKFDIHPCWGLFDKMECRFMKDGKLLDIRADGLTKEVEVIG